MALYSDKMETRLPQYSDNTGAKSAQYSGNTEAILAQYSGKITTQAATQALITLSGARPEPSTQEDESSKIPPY